MSTKLGIYISTTCNDACGTDTVPSYTSNCNSQVAI